MMLESEEETMKRQGKNCDEGHCREVLPKNWGPGPWETEPNRIDFRAFGFPCFVHRAWVTGSWCGYVGVTKAHPAFGHHYDSVRVSVHGGLTYSDKCGGHLCHPSGGNIWWLGYDTAHFMDYSPRLEAVMRELRERQLPDFMKDAGIELLPKRRKEGDGPANGLGFMTEDEDGTHVLHEHYWTLEESVKETKDLARQLRDATGHNIKTTEGFGKKDRKKSLKKMKQGLTHWDFVHKYELGSSKFKMKSRGRRPNLG